MRRGRERKSRRGRGREKERRAIEDAFLTRCSNSLSPARRPRRGRCSGVAWRPAAAGAPGPPRRRTRGQEIAFDRVFFRSVFAILDGGHIFAFAPSRLPSVARSRDESPCVLRHRRAASSALHTVPSRSSASTPPTRMSRRCDCARREKSEREKTATSERWRRRAS